MTLPLNLADVLAARRTITGTVVRTPLVASPYLSEAAGTELLLKLESVQPVGAFKLRGAVNAVAHLPPDTPGVTCCSTGNHGRALAFAARARGLRAVVCLSPLVPAAKVDAIRALGAEVRIVGRSQDGAAVESRRLAEQEGLAEVPPFDDPHVIAGQGTAGLELMEDRPDLATVLVPLSGGGLAAGVALAVKATNPSARVIGVSMDRGAAMHAAFAAGRPVDVEEVPSLADSLGGGLGSGNRLTYALCRRLLDDILLVTEAEIYAAMQALYWHDRLVTEGAAAVGAAAILAGRLAADGPVALLVTGRNVDMETFTRVVTGQPVTLGDLTLEGHPHAA
jgi:threonine dehydratase